MIDHLIRFAVLESIVILVLAEPVLNRMSPCAPVRRAIVCACDRDGERNTPVPFGGIGHTPSWSSLLVGGFAALLLCHQIGNLWCEDRRKEPRHNRRASDVVGR